MRTKSIVLAALLLAAAFLGHPVATSAAQDKVTLVYASNDGGDPAKVTDTVLAQFSAKTGIEVKAERLNGGGTQMNSDLLVRMAAGTAPDIFMINSADLRVFVNAKEGGLLDLTPYVKADSSWNPENDIFSELEQAGVVDGKIYAFPKDYATLVYYVNTDLFKAAGVSLPTADWTYTDLVKIAKELTLDANGNNANSPVFDPTKIKQYGWWHENWQLSVAPIIYSYGAEYVSPDGTKATGFVNSKAFADALRFYQDAVQKHHITPSLAALDAQPGVDLFASGQAAIRGPFGPWVLTGYSQNPSLKFSFVPLPKGSAGRRSPLLMAQFVVNKGTKHPQQAYELIRYLATTAQTNYATVALTANKNASKASNQSGSPLYGPFVEAVNTIYRGNDVKTVRFSECVETPVGDLVQAIQTIGGDKIDVQAELDKIATKADACLAGSAATPASK